MTERNVPDWTEWQALNVPYGGQVDLSEVWSALEDPADTTWDRVRNLIKEAPGGRPRLVAERLERALREMELTRDAMISVHLRTAPGRVTLTAWSQYATTPWWVGVEFAVAREHGWFMAVPARTVTLVTGDWEGMAMRTHAITYTDTPGGPVGHIIADWFTKLLGRAQFGQMAGIPAAHLVADEPISREEFAAMIVRQY